MEHPLVLYLLIVNAAGFVLMLADKHKAKKNKWRVRESTLLGVAIIGGSIGVLAGMYTNRENAETLQGLNDYLQAEDMTGESVILFGNIPALAFYYELKPALSSTWPDLPSYSGEKFTTELDNMKEMPMIIVSANPADIGKVEGSKDALKQKIAYLEQFMAKNEYVQTFKNDAFVVYRCQ